MDTTAASVADVVLAMRRYVVLPQTPVLTAMLKVLDASSTTHAPKQLLAERVESYIQKFFGKPLVNYFASFNSQEKQDVWLRLTVPGSRLYYYWATQIALKQDTFENIVRSELFRQLLFTSRQTPVDDTLNDQKPFAIAALGAAVLLYYVTK